MLCGVWFVVRLISQLEKDLVSLVVMVCSDVLQQINGESFDHLRGQVKAAVDFGRQPTVPVIDEAKVGVCARDI